MRYAVLLVLLLWAVPCHADELTTIIPGPLLSKSFLEKGVGYGVEVSMMYGSSMGGVGGFSQAEILSKRRRRFALGAQAGSFVGLEAGWAMVTEGEDSSRWSGPHLGLYGSVGVANMGLRFTIPVENDAGDLPGLDFGVVFSLKLPLTLPNLEFPTAHDRFYL